MTTEITTFKIISKIESSDNIASVRYEPTYPFYTSQTLMNFKKFNNADVTTAEMMCKSSFGLVQIMGAHLYDRLNYKKSILDFWSSPTDQEECFYNLLHEMGISTNPNPVYLLDQTARDDFAHRYNGNIGAYSASILATLEFYDVK